MSLFNKIFNTNEDRSKYIDFSKVKIPEEKYEKLLETHQIRFEPEVELKKAKRFFTSAIQREKNEKYEYKTIIHNNTKLFIETANYARMVNEKEEPAGEYLTGLTMMGAAPSMRNIMNPMDALVNFGPEPSGFERMDFFELAGLIAYNLNCTVIRDDIGYDEVEFLPEEVLKFARF